MTSFHPRGLQAVRDRKFKSKRPRSNSDSFQEGDLKQGFQWVSEQLMLIKKNLMCAWLGRLALFRGWLITKQTFPSTLWQISLEKKINIKKSAFSFPSLTPPHSPLAEKEPPFWSSFILLELGETGWRFLCYSLQRD